MNKNNKSNSKRSSMSKARLILLMLCILVIALCGIGIYIPVSHWFVEYDSGGAYISTNVVHTPIDQQTILEASYVGAEDPQKQTRDSMLVELGFDPSRGHAVGVEYQDCRTNTVTSN